MRRRSAIIALILLLVAVLLNLPAGTEARVKDGTRANLAPFRNGMSLLIDRVSGLFRLASEHRAREKRLAELAHELTEVRLDLQRLKLEAAECDRLRELLAFRKRQPHTMVMCRVVARGELSGWWQTVRLDRGAAEGITENMAVVTAAGLVGKTTTVADDFCDVLMITDPNCRVSCLVPKTGGFGMVNGSGVTPDGAGHLEMLSAAGFLRLEYVPRDERIGEGYEVVTSGLGGVYPEGIVVGHIRRAGVEPSGLYQQADILPSARLDTLRYAFVIVRPGRTAP